MTDIPALVKRMREAASRLWAPLTPGDCSDIIALCQAVEEAQQRGYVTAKRELADENGRLNTLRYEAESRAELAEARATQAEQRPTGGEGGMSDHFAVTVWRNGESLVTIESYCLSGKAEFTEAEAETIRTAALHLMAFIGERSPDMATKDAGTRQDDMATDGALRGDD